MAKPCSDRGLKLSRRRTGVFSETDTPPEYRLPKCAKNGPLCDLPHANRCPAMRTSTWWKKVGKQGAAVPVLATVRLGEEDGVRPQEPAGRNGALPRADARGRSRARAAALRSGRERHRDQDRPHRRV